MTVSEGSSLEAFAAGCSEAIVRAQETTESILLTNEPFSSDVLVCELPIGAGPGVFRAAARSLMFDCRMFAAMSTRTNWSPDPGPSSPAWTFTAVGRDGGPAIIAVRRDVEDDRWWRILPSEAPWFALATAASLRGALRGEPLVPKKVPPDDRRLLDAPGIGPPPPTDRNGRI